MKGKKDDLDKISYFYKVEYMYKHKPTRKIERRKNNDVVSLRMKGETLVIILASET